MSRERSQGWQVVNADTRKPVRRSYHRSPVLALQALYSFIGANPGEDFLVVDEAGSPVPASRLQVLSLAELAEHR